jgi:hypothetical protein
MSGSHAPCAGPAGGRQLRDCGCATNARAARLSDGSRGSGMTARLRRRGTWVITGLVLACATSACSSAAPIPTPTSTSAAQFRLADAPALLVQCMLNQGTLGRSDSIFAGPPAWLRGGDIVITPATAAKFNTWYQANDAISVAGKDLSAWSHWAAANNMLPSGVCGTSVSAPALQKRVFGKDPDVGDPWGA